MLARHRASRRKVVGGAFKRGFDLLAASLGLILLAPLLLAIAILVRLDSRGPSLFVQRRGGLHGRPFLCVKFRTMTSQDDGRAIEQAQPGDGRVTKLGAFLRKTSLDELPQLLNVLRGDMSLVGPRPHALAHDRLFATIDGRYRLRGHARPGITGLAQVRGQRGPTQTEDAVRARLEHDLAYVGGWSPLLDLWILIRTALLVVHDPRAF